MISSQDLKWPVLPPLTQGARLSGTQLLAFTLTMVWCVTVEQPLTLWQCTSVIKVIYQVQSLVLEFAGMMEHGLEVPPSAVSHNSIVLSVNCSSLDDMHVHYIIAKVICTWHGCSRKR